MRYGFGVDVGGTTVKLGLLSEDGAMPERWEIPTRTGNGGAEILPDIALELTACIRRRGLEKSALLGVGIGVPGPVNEYGVVNRCVNLNWGVVDVGKTLGQLTGLNVRVGNDANCAALGEYWKGGGAGSRSAMLVTLGTGIGGGIIWNGRLLTGAHGVAGELGHISVCADETVRCTCGKTNCVEQFASAGGIVRLARKRLEDGDRPSFLRALPGFCCEDVFAAAAAGDALAGETLEQVYDCLAQALAAACCVCDPECVILGGGVSNAGEVLRAGVERRFRVHRFHACRDTRFVLAKLGNDAGICGAFRLQVLD